MNECGRWIWAGRKINIINNIKIEKALKIYIKIESCIFAKVRLVYIYKKLFVMNVFLFRQMLNSVLEILFKPLNNKVLLKKL
jgi:hypothetical protein